MPKRSENPHTKLDRQCRRDFELCKVVFVAAISQILFARRAFRPQCFQVVPLEQLRSRSFEDTVAWGSGVHSHDKELLRDRDSVVFLRQETDYGINRFLGILREDIFPLIENEGLVKFQISYLRTKAWERSSLAEYYTVAFNYELGGMITLDIWRAGTGRLQAAATGSQLRNLGDYLSRLPSWTEPTHWTLAFHATERHDDPPIGVWKFDRTDFDEARLDLQQKDEYSYTRLARLKIMPLPIDEPVAETSPEPEIEMGIVTKSRSKRQKTQSRASKHESKGSVPRRLAAAGGDQCPPPQTLISSGKNRENDAGHATIGLGLAHRSLDKAISQGTEGIHSPNTNKDKITRRKPKRTLQLFEDAASSLPPTQIIGESQSLSQIVQQTKAHRDDASGPAGRGSFEEGASRSPSPDPFSLLDGISLSSEDLSAAEGSPRVSLSRDPHPSAPSPLVSMPTAGSGNQVQLASPSSILLAKGGIRQWEPVASPAPNLLGIALSDGSHHGENPSDTGAKDLGSPSAEVADNSRVTFHFSPKTVARRTSLLYDIPSSSVVGDLD